LSPGLVDWLQALFHWGDNNAVFIVDVSNVCANSRPQKIGKKQILVRAWSIKQASTHTAFLKIFRVVHEQKD